jgi:hypothetical protein
MRRLLIGPIVTGCGYAAGAYYGADAEQVVRKSPDVVQSSIEAVVDNRASGTFQPDGGKAIPYELKLDDHAPGEPLVVRMTLNGREGVVARIRLTPAANGEATLMVVQLHTDHSVLREALAGTAKARLAYAPDWMLNLTAKPVLQKLAEQIEGGEALGDPMHGFESQADWESSLQPDQQKKIQEWRQYDASRPTTDPNADANHYLGRSNSGN